MWRRIPAPEFAVRALALDGDGKIWVDFGYLEPDSADTLRYVSLKDKVPAEDRGFSDVSRIVTTPKGTFFQANERLFRWDDKRMQVWVPRNAFAGLSEVRGRIYTVQTGIGLEEIVGDEFWPLLGGDALSHSSRVLLHPWDDQHILISAFGEGLTLYMATAFRHFALRRTPI